MPDHIEEEHPRGEPAPGAPRETAAATAPPPVVGNIAKGLGIGLVVVVCVAVWGTCFSYIRATTTPRAWKNDAFVLEGEFRPDGSCAVRLDGRLISNGDSARTEFDPRSILGAAPEEFDVPQVTCELAAREYGYFFVWGPVRAGEPVRPGRYRIVPDAILEGDTTAWEATLFQQRFSDERAYLVGYDGWVRFVRADSAAVSGAFRVVARRKLRGPFE